MSSVGLPTATATAGVQLLAVGLVAVFGVAALSRVRPAVSRTSLAALVPWVVTGATVYAGAQSAGLGSLVFSPPWVYVAVGGISALVWAVATVIGRESTVLGGVGVAGAFVSGAVFESVTGPVRLQWPLLSLAAATILTVAVWTAFVRGVPELEQVGWLGPFALFGQTFDGVTTLVGVDVLGFPERVTLSRWVLELAAGLPTADVFGVGWLFLAVKIAIVSVVLRLAGAWEDDERSRNVFLWIVGVVGLGPAVHNFVLYSLS